MFEGSVLLPATLASLLLVLYLFHKILKGPGDLTPPGPKPHPLVGHTFQVPKIKTWKYFEQLYHRYG